MSQDSFMSVTWLSVNLLSSLMRTRRQWWTCQFWGMPVPTSYMVLGFEHRSHLRKLSPHVTLIESVSDSLARIMHTSSLLAVIII